MTPENTDLLSFAGRAMNTAPRSLVHAINPRSAGGRQDFSSEGDYWWPDPANPAGPYIRRDGCSNPDQFLAHRELLIDMAADVAALAAAWRISENPDLCAAATRHLETWFVASETRMNPDLRFAQAIPRLCVGRGIGMIDTVHLCEVALAVRAFGSHLPAHVAAATLEWFAEYLEWMSTSPEGREEKAEPNNHGTCWYLQAACFARVTGDAAALQSMRDTFPELLRAQMAPNGSFPLELARTKPYAYSLFNLDIFCALAVVLDDGGPAFLLPLLQSVEYHAPFVADKSHWPHQHDIAHWEEWPLRHPFLFFSGRIAGRQEWVDLWRSLPAVLPSWEARRNFPIRTPSLWPCRS